MNYAAVLSTFADLREQEGELIARWARDVEAAAKRAPSNPGQQLMRQLPAGFMHPAVAVSILARVFSGLQINAANPAYRAALACLGDAISELEGEYLGTTAEDDDGPHWDDAVYDRKRDDERDFV